MTEIGKQATMELEPMRIYLDTSVISFLEADDEPIRRDETRALWEMLMSEEYEVVVSDHMLAELARTPEPKREKLLGWLGAIRYSCIFASAEANALALLYLANGVLTEKSYADLRHIATAVSCGCDIVLSWNFRYMANPRTMARVNEVNRLSGYQKISIVGPTMLIGGE